MPEMTAAQAAEWERSPGFRAVWEILQEVGRKQAEAAEQSKETERILAETAEQSKETERILAETAEQSKETKRILAEYARQMKESSAEAAEQSKETKRVLAEYARQMKESSAEADRKFAEAAEQSKKTDQEIEKTGRQIRELSVNIGGVNSTLGKWSEEMVAAKLCEKINVFGYEFTRCARNIKYWENGEKIAEVDSFLENGDFVMPVETKTDVTTGKVDKYIEKVNRIRRYMDSRGDRRTIVGAVAGAVVPESVCRYAQKKGLYVLAQSGESMAVAEAPEGFKPRKWEKT